MATVQRTDRVHAAIRVSPELLDRMPPHSLEAERGVLGSLLIDPELCDEVALILQPDDFYAEANAKLYAHMTAMHSAGGRIDAMLLRERLKQQGDLEAVGGSAYLAEVINSVPVAAHAVYYANIVRDKATLRALIHTSTEILRDAWDPALDPRDALNQAEEKVFAVHDRRTTSQVANIHDVMVEAFARIDSRMAGGEGGIPTGFTDLDKLTGGLHRSELVILAARPSMGKTALATNIAEHVAIEENVPTLFVSLEMARIELAQRILCSQGRIDAGKFRSGFLSGSEREQLVRVSNRLSKTPLFIDDSSTRTVTEIGATARRLKRRSDLGFLVIDYLQLINPDDPRDPRQEQVAKMARRLKALARELEVPILCLAQLNRQAELGREGHRPRLSHLRESGAIEQDADVVMFIHREEYYNRDDENARGKGEVIVAKQRNGPTGDVELAWFDKFTRFENLAHQPYDEFD
ncbi:MAG: replicative DNA helicase [Thermoguttaceae bacterium]|jgi:replicative DNA helicase|nr:replicative DNA helicase [Thermoguttaceae bacterium]